MAEKSRTEKPTFVLLTIVFGKFSFETQAPIVWQNDQVTEHAASYAKQLNQDIQLLRPYLDDGLDDGFS